MRFSIYEILWGMFYPDNWAFCGKAMLGNSVQDYKFHALTWIKQKTGWRDRMDQLCKAAPARDNELKVTNVRIEISTFLNTFSLQVRGGILNAHLLEGKIINLAIRCNLSNSNAQFHSCLMFKLTGQQICKFFSSVNWSVFQYLMVMMISEPPWKHFSYLRVIAGLRVKCSYERWCWPQDVLNFQMQSKTNCVCIPSGPEPEPKLYTRTIRSPGTKNRNGNMSPNPVNTSSSPGNVSIEEKEPMTWQLRGTLTRCQWYMRPFVQMIWSSLANELRTLRQWGLENNK